MKHLIIISPEETVNEEINIVNALFDEGLQYFHLRKPHFSPAEQEMYLSRIKPQYLKNISIHQHHSADIKNQVVGFHFKESKRLKIKAIPIMRNLDTPYRRLSTSLHDADSIKTISAFWDYVFLSPIAESVSKPGYKNNKLVALKLVKSDNVPPVIALGGITTDNAEHILLRGFDGIAVLGSIWNDSGNAIKTFRKLQRICRN